MGPLFVAAALTWARVTELAGRGLVDDDGAPGGPFAYQIRSVFGVDSRSRALGTHEHG